MAQIVTYTVATGDSETLISKPSLSSWKYASADGVTFVFRSKMWNIHVHC